MPNIKPVRKAVFPVAGLGTRFLPATKAIPKELLPILDKPLIQYAFEEAKQAGIEQFIFVSGDGKEAIEKHFSAAAELEKALRQSGKQVLLDKVQESNIPKNDIFVVKQKQALGLGHAIWCAKDLIQDEPFAVLLPDDLFFSEPACLQQLVDIHSDIGGNVVAVIDVEREDTARYGILDVVSDDGEKVTADGLVEKPMPDKAPSNVAITGRYILTPDIFTFLDKQVKGLGGEIQLTDAIASTFGKAPFTGWRFTGEHFDCGVLDGWLRANLYLALNRPDTQSIVSDYLDDLGFHKE